ncbi:hypothetical protein quinque_013515 [Culex quinquefasciatus]
MKKPLRKCLPTCTRHPEKTAVTEVCFKVNQFDENPTTRTGTSGRCVRWFWWGSSAVEMTLPSMAVSPARNRSRTRNPNEPQDARNTIPALLVKHNPDRNNDLRLAKHITFVHSHVKLPLTRIKTLEMSLFRGFNALCKCEVPVIPLGLSEYIVNAVQNTSNKIFALMRKLAVASNTVKISDVMERCTTKDYKPGQEDACIEE